MKHKLIEKIVRIFNEGQDKFHIFLDNAGTGDGILWIKDCGTKLYADVIKARDLPIHGFLINREYGFAEARAKYKYKFRVVLPCSPLYGLTKLQRKTYDIKEGARLFLTFFAAAVDKTIWLEENL